MLVNQISTIEEMPYTFKLSGDSIYWELIKGRSEVIPFLIEKLDDHTLTTAVVPNFGGYYAVGDVCMWAIGGIIKGVPYSDFIPNDGKNNGAWDYWRYVRESKGNRREFKAKVKMWFSRNKSNLKWVEDDNEYETGPEWKFESNTLPSGGYYILK
ncbi:MAG: hypothetical protein HEP71_08450 [Roseivirga sp.]|nr:hypothetical protein [Roseivirga sp.]